MTSGSVALSHPRRSGNRRTGALLLLMAVLFFVGIVLKTWIFGR